MNNSFCFGVHSTPGYRPVSIMHTLTLFLASRFILNVYAVVFPWTLSIVNVRIIEDEEIYKVQ